MESSHPPPSFSSFIDFDTLNSIPQSSNSQSRRKDHHARKESRRQEDESNEERRAPKRRRKLDKDGERGASSSSRKHRRQERDHDAPTRSTYEQRDSNRAQERQDRFRPVPVELEGTGQMFYEDRAGVDSSIFIKPDTWFIAGHRQVLGVPHQYRVFTKHGSNQFELFIPGRRLRNTARAFKFAAIIKTKRLVPNSKSSASTVPWDPEATFLALQRPRDSRRDEDPAYRSIHTSSNTNADEEENLSDSELDDDPATWSDSDVEIEDALSAETTRLTRLLNSSPTDPHAWMRLISHTASTNPTPAGRADVWLTMLEKAMASHLSLRKSSVLRIKYLDIIRDVRGLKEEELQWDKALTEIKSEGLWVDYIGWRLRRAGIESIDTAISRIYSLADGMKDWPESRRVKAKLRVFWRGITALREAGFHERATAILQSQIELTYLFPLRLASTSFPDLLQGLEEYWESDVPRIGEAGAEGWANWYSRNMSNENLNAVPVASSVLKDSSNSMRNDNTSVGNTGDGYIEWAQKERLLDYGERIPHHDSLHPSSTTEEDDPYSTVMFDDIRAFLFPLPPSTFQDGDNDSLLLPLISLQILGLHIPGLVDLLLTDETSQEAEGVDSRWAHPLASRTRLPSTLFGDPPSTPASIPSASFVNDLGIGQERRMGSGWGPIKEWGYSTNPGGSLSGHGTRGEGRMWEKFDLDDETVDVAFLRRWFEQLDLRIQSSVWVNYWIAFEAAVDAKEAMKLSKTALSRFPQSLLLWSSYAQLNRIRGKPDGARKVYRTCLMTNAAETIFQSIEREQDPPPDSLERLKMWRAWAEMEWLEGDHSAVARVLCSANGISLSEGGDPGVSLLRCRTALEAALSTLLSRVTTTTIFFCPPILDLLAIFELNQPSNVPRALDMYNRVFDIFSGPSQPALPHRVCQSILEMVHTSSALLIYHYTYTLRNTSPPALLRNRVDTSIRQFPANTLLLGIWLETERGEAVWGRVRSGISDIVLGGMAESGANTSVNVVGLTRWMWAVWVETWERGVWNAARVRELLRRALEQPSLRSSPALWLVRLQLEIRAGRLKDAQNDLFQAIASCPWYKNFYLYAFSELRSVFTSDTLGRVMVNAMTERGIRLRASHNLEDYIEVAEVVDDGNDDEEPAGEMELEHASNELRRLMPY